ncbi:T9SS type A sorting domain-containing protein [Hymenobacter jeollabukensis]|uniref:T9SS type A sorting domain-containing protein n=1 Tax=Hymenobacter jeollabukensis TaxID=2025313 RepID=A0A5R8WSW3_9BACT|nr:T9SS type A sorting domain-containing protein [Hymenobacter jeollabukensis]TLM94273.1 T9SS type A sorting domain-containing protein [Hymenobacter jeollabukensis]
MKKLVLPLFLALAAAAALPSTALAQSTCPATPTPITITGTITTNTTWTSNNIYLLSGYVYVANGATLTIQPGTIIKADKTPTPGGVLVVLQGGKLIADGTAAQPIVFTSNQPAGSRNRGDWGGIVICGRAPINQPGSPAVEGVPSATFGGTDANDNSGVLRYVRIEYPGVALSQNNEINGLTLAGVGAGTTIDYVSVYASGDDSFEWFGGTVNAKHLVAIAATDDDFDTDFGFTGKVQYAVTVRDPNQADVSGSTAFESDNDANSSTLTPITAPVFSNVSAFLTNPSVAANFTRAMHLRRNSQISIFNSVLTGWPVGLTLDGSTTQANATSGALVLKNNVMAGMTTDFQSASPTTYNVQGFWGDASRSNTTYANISSLGLNADNFTINSAAASTNSSTAPNFTLPAASPLVSGAAFTDAKLAGGFFENVAYRGAFGPSGNWTAGWTNYNPQNTCYNVAGVTSAKAKSAAVQGLSVYPNPTAGASQLSFTLARPAAVTVRVLDVTGRTVATVSQDRTLTSGEQQLALPGNLKSGLYTATVQTGESVEAVRFVVTQ